MSETIPPSLVLITIGAVTGVSIAALFTGGLMPAVVGMIALGIVVYIQSRGVAMKGVTKASLPEGTEVVVDGYQSRDHTVLRANGISATATPAWNLRGNLTIAGGRDSAEVRFQSREADAEYFVTCTVAGGRGSPQPGARRLWISDKTPLGFRVHCEEAPGGDSSVAIDWILVR